VSRILAVPPEGRESASAARERSRGGALAESSEDQMLANVNIPTGNSSTSAAYFLAHLHDSVLKPLATFTQSARFMTSSEHGQRRIVPGAAAVFLEPSFLYNSRRRPM